MEKEFKYVIKGGPHRKTGDSKKYCKGDTIMLTKREADVIAFKLESAPAQDIPEEVDEDAREEMKLKMVHKGAGKWIVVNEATGEAIHDGKLKKAAAQDMVDGVSDKSEKENEDEDEDNWEDEE